MNNHANFIKKFQEKLNVKKIKRKILKNTILMQKYIREIQEECFP